MIEWSFIDSGYVMESQFVRIEGAENIVITARLSAQIVKDGGGYCVHCPALGIVTQGDTIAEARANIKEAAELMIEVCFERGTLARRLAKSGFRPVGEKPARRKARRKVAGVFREIRFPAKIPLLSYC